MAIFWAFMKFLAVQIVVSLLTPKPKIPNAKRYELSDFQVPTASEDRAQVMPFGSPKIAGNVIWYGDYSAVPKKKKVKTGLFSSKKVTVGYRYYIGQWMSLAAVTCDSIHEVRVGERVVWAGTMTLSDTASTVLDVAKEWNNAEGQEIPDGFKARLEFFNYRFADTTRTFSPPANPYMLEQVGLVPAYPDRLHLVVHGPKSAASPSSGFIGSGPHLEPLLIGVRRMSKMEHAFRRWSYSPAPPPVYGQTAATLPAFIEANNDISGDTNPAFALVELLTTPVPGIGPKLIPEALDLADFLRAGEQLKTEGNGATFSWETSKPVGEICDGLMEQIAGVWRINTATGQLGMRLLRETDTPVAVFDNSNTISLDSVKRTATEEAINEVVVPFVDRYLNWQSRTLIARDPAGYKAAGTAITRTVDFIGVSRELLARQLATRELRASATPLARVRFTAVAVPGLILQPGDLVTLEHAELAQTMRLRVLSARFGGYDNRARLEIEAAEDIFRSGIAGEIEVDVPPSIEYPTPPTSLINATLTPAPYALTGSDYDRPLYIAEDPGTEVDGFQAVLQEARSTWSNTAPAEYIDGTFEPAIRGLLTATLPSSDVTTFTMTLSSAAIEQWKREARGALFLIAGKEWMQCSSWSLNEGAGTLTATGVVRGIFDTVPGRHIAGTAVRILLGYAIDEAPLKTRLAVGTYLDGLTAICARAESRGRGGVLEPNDAAPSFAAWTFADNATSARAPKPTPPGRVYLGSQVLGVLSADDTAPDVTRFPDMLLGWNRRTRASRSVGGYYGSAPVPEAGTEVGFAVAAEVSPGVWQSYGPYTWVGYEFGTANFSTANFPTGARRMRVRLIARRTTNTGQVIEGDPFEVYWKLTN